MTRVPRRHGDRHGESKGTSTKISDLKKMVLAYLQFFLNEIAVFSVYFRVLFYY